MTKVVVIPLIKGDQYDKKKVTKFSLWGHSLTKYVDKKRSRYIGCTGNINSIQRFYLIKLKLKSK